MASTVREQARELPEFADVDVVVCGGGPAGVAAAIAAARQGAETLLVERYGFLGGMATAGLVTSILGHAAQDGTLTVAGLCREWVDRMADLGGARPWEEASQNYGIGFDPDVCKRVFDLMVAEAGAGMLLHALVCGAAGGDGGPEAAILETKQGRVAVRADAFIDATGDADLVARAGLPFTKGRAFDRRPMAAGSTFFVEGIDVETASEHAEEIKEKFEEARRSGKVTSYSGIWPNSERMRLNKTRVAVDATDAADLTDAEVETRRQIFEMVRFMRENLPGFENCRVERTPASVGLRETRQAVGDYVMTQEDVLECARHDDGIARSSYWIDIHCPYGYTHPAHYCRPDCPAGEECRIMREAPEQLPRATHPPEGGWCHVPYRSLIVRDADNVLAAGRCISADHHAMGAVRVMAICMAIGEAAGTAAALAVENGGNVREVETRDLRAKLKQRGAIV
jgi:glycine/D-amino acid oxidase-like deaminating enzyme